MGSRVSARGLAWDVLEVAPLGAQTLLRLRCTDGDLDGPGMGHPASGRTGRNGCARNFGRMHRDRWLRGGCYHQACLLEQVLGPDGHAVGGARSGPDRALPARSVDARTGIAATAPAARRRRGSGQDDRGGADRLRADRTQTGASCADRRACGTAARAMDAGNAPALRLALHRHYRCRVIAAATAQGWSWAAIRSTRSRSA